MLGGERRAMKKVTMLSEYLDGLLDPYTKHEERREKRPPSHNMAQHAWRVALCFMVYSR